MKKLTAIFLVLLVLSPAGTLAAGSGSEYSNPYADIAAGDLTEHGTQDMSVQLINRIAGKNWQHALNPAVDVEQTVFMQLFKVFNALVLVMAGLLITWVLIQGIVSTAHEGTPLGQQLHSLWVPVRSGLSVLFLLPIPGSGGFSILQGIVLLFFSFSIGAANLMWAKGLDYMTKNIVNLEEKKEFTAKDVKNWPKGDARETLLFLIVNHYVNDDEWSYYTTATANYVPGAEIGNTAIDIAQEALSEGPAPSDYQKNWTGDAPQFLETSGNKGSVARFKIINNNEYGGPTSSDIGYIDVPCEDLDSLACGIRVSAMKDFIEESEPVAKYYLDMNDIVSEKTSDVWQFDRPHKVGRMYFNSIVEDYNEKVGEAIANSLNDGELNPTGSEETEAFREKAKKLGWASAGMWYWTLSAHFKRRVQTARAVPTYTGGNFKAISEFFGEPYSKCMEKIRNNMGGITSAKDIIQNAERSSNQSDIFGPKYVQAWIKPISDYVNPLKDMPRAMTKGDPIRNLKWYGNVIVNSYFSAASIFVGLRGAAKATQVFNTTTDASSLVPGWGEAEGLAAAIAASIKVVLADTWSLLQWILIPLLFAGIFLAYYLPSIPFIYWYLGIVSWVILFIETLVAAPLWAAAHSMPEGRGIAGKHAKTGYMMFFNVLVRPLLMIFGFLAAMLIFSGVFAFLGEAFMVFKTTISSGMEGIIESSIFTVIFTGLIIVSAQKIFALVTVLANRVPRWIGQQIQPLGEEQQQKEVKTGFVAAGSTTQAAGRMSGSESQRPSAGSGSGSEALPAGGASALDSSNEDFSRGES